MTTSSNLSVERLVRVETKLESMGYDISDIKASILRMEASFQSRLDKQDERTWSMWAKIGGLSAAMSIIITFLAKYL